MPERWMLPGYDTWCYWVILGNDKDKNSFKKIHKQVTPSSLQGLMEGWWNSDPAILQDIYREVKKGSRNTVVPSKADQLKTALLQEFQKGGLMAFEAKLEPIQLPPVTVRAAYTGATLRSVHTNEKGALPSLLQQTLLHATNGPVRSGFTGAPRLVAFNSQQLAELKRLNGDDVRVQTKKVWEYQHPTLDTVTQVTARHRGMGDMPMPVLDSITWGDVSVKLYGGASIPLPLTQAFLLKTESVDEGVIPASEKGFWQLPANLHSSFHHIFGYDISPSGEVGPITTPGVLLPRGSNQPFRVLVCLALGCMGERNEFEPGGVLGAARLLPHLMIATNRSAESIEGAITLTRNERTPHTSMDGDEMTPETSSGLYTDNNSKGLLPELPFWNLLFDYYSTDPTPGKFEVVKRGAAERTLVDAVKSFHEEIATGPTESMPAGATYRPRDVTKLARQGEFDNIHIAPKMKLPWEVVAKSPPSWNLNAPVAMAPFCAHDCFHTHWRWGNLFYDFGVLNTNPKWVRGWGGGTTTSPGTPFSEPGAPLVPCNQDVTLHLLSKRSFKYVARAYAPAAGEWQIIMHHGSAYALDTTKLAERIKSVLATLEGPPANTSKGKWARFYWALRYGTYVYNRFADANPRLPPTAVGLKFAERLQMDPTTLAKLRAL
ncbi:hypothetical protein F0U62_49630 [Cystobacter fuscus]|uniref:hypothetical protein n=1 Tax=Cystobacter fuscus TaxID=43 RepID=UPI002B2EF14E|nr:hypothetical protein F0U62_49630 [Cystobacter fuscus]